MESLEVGVEYVFDSSFGSKQLKIFEMPDATLGDNIMSGKTSAYLIGNSKIQKSALCTSDTTYIIKQIESSNHILVSDNSCVFGESSSYFELTRHKPELSEAVLQSLLKTQYRGAHHDTENLYDRSSFRTSIELRSTILCSEKEFSILLKEHDVVELNGVMRMISPDVKLDIIEELFDIIILNDYSIECLTESSCLHAIHGVDMTILRCVLHSVGVVSDENARSWRLCYDKVSAYSARILLRSLDKDKIVLKKNDFLSSWSSRTPASKNCPPPETSLQGVALFAEDSSVILADHNNLPLEIKSRLRSLFELKKELTTEELLPYLLGLPIINEPHALLLLYCNLGSNQKWTIHA